ncbi:HNH endonuclease [Serratia rubidaea]|uniref:phosphorothioated DNA-binding restriction endonuclease n=1 Tax=Serratia rubidaea TaxID=61652 RepID=UPI0023B11F7C|nr:HNH endonuclease [Serratia rubidaea]MDK1704619.1 HNH endonuclease [Serratia rubidaea]
MTTFAALQSAISNVSVWRQGDVCAPHKPLLLLYVLSQYKAGHPRLFNYGREIHEPLTRLLKEFGPKRRTDYPNMPFWRLRSDGFWEIANAESCKPRKGNTQPTKKELIDNQVAGGFDESHYRRLQEHPQEIDKLAQQILTDRFPESVQRILANQLGFDFIDRSNNRDPRFREIVLRAYHSRCAFCGYDLRLDGALVGIEAAHIHWKVYGGPCVISNGIALCSLHHSAFDMGAFGLDEDMTIRISGGVSRSPVVDQLFWQKNQQRLLLPHDKALWPAEQYVGWHRKQIFKA